MTVQAWFADDEIDLRPGASVSLALSIENVAEATETYTVLPTGLTAPWTTVTRPNITLFGGSRDVVEVVVRPPAVHTTTAGPTTVAVRIIPLEEPDDTVVAEATVVVASFDDRRISMLQPLQRARRRADYELMVENHGNNLASCRLHLVDPTDRVDGSFDPPAVGVPPGGSSLVRLRLKARRGGFRRRERQLDFEIEATQPDHERAIGRGSLIQSPTVPMRFVWRALGVAALAAAAAGAWFGVVRPELRSAAERAVDDRIAELSTGTPTTVAPDAPGPAAPDGEAPSPDRGADGTPFSTRLALAVEVGTTGSESFRVPDGSQLLLTDIVLQNPNADLGTASLLRNTEVLYRWDLGAMASSNEFEPRVTPLPFEPGDQIVVQSTCAGSGVLAGTTCDVAVLLSGRLVPVTTATGAGT